MNVNGQAVAGLVLVLAVFVLMLVLDYLLSDERKRHDVERDRNYWQEPTDE